MLGYLKHGDLERGKEEEIENIAALLVLNVQALFKLGILYMCLSVSKHSPTRKEWETQYTIPIPYPKC